MTRRIETAALCALVVWALAFATGCYTTRATRDGAARVNRLTGEVCIYAVAHDDDGNRFVDVYCEE